MPTITAGVHTVRPAHVILDMAKPRMLGFATLEDSAIRFTDYGDVAALRATARVVKHHGMATGPALPLDMTPGGPHRAAELVVLGRLMGCVAEMAFGLVMGERILGRTVGRAVAALSG